MIRLSLYEKNPQTVLVKFEYDAIILQSVKSIPGRSYLPSEKGWLVPYKHIKKLTSLFDKSNVILEEGIDVDYKENDQYDFEKEFSLLKLTEFKTFARYVLKHIPNYFYDSAAISDNDDNNKAYKLKQEKGLMLHTISAIKIAHSLSLIHQLPDEKHDILLISAFMHDIFKFGLSHDKEIFAPNHPLLCVEYFDEVFANNYDDLNISVKYICNKYWNEISECIKSHEGPSNIYISDKIRLPLPKTKMQKLLYECNFLASCGYINM